MDNWKVEGRRMPSPYSASCSSRAAEGFFVGSLTGVVWGVIMHGTSMDSESKPSPTTPQSRLGSPRNVDSGKMVGMTSPGRSILQGVKGYGKAAVTSAGAFGLFVGVLHGSTCLYERVRGTQDMLNVFMGGASAGLSIAFLSRHTRGPQALMVHAVGGGMAAAVIGSLSSARVEDAE